MAAEGNRRNSGGVEDFLPLSALQHLVFCERQCALIHVERIWEENRLTAEGRTLHEKVDEDYRRYQRGIKQFAGLSVRSERLRLQGRIDMLEVIQATDGGQGHVFAGISAVGALLPVEFKRGRPKRHDADRVQLCAQAMCLEEMTGAPVPVGALFYGQIRRRVEVVLEPELRRVTEAAANRLHALVASGTTPPAVHGAHCRSCSLVKACQPHRASGGDTDAYRQELFG